MTGDIFDQADEQASYAPTRRNFGKIEITVATYIHWVDRVKNDVTAEQYATLKPNEKSLELLFAVDIQEFRPDLDFTYDRRLRPANSDDNWKKIFVPSVTDILGKDSMQKGIYSTTLRNLNGKYVEVEDVPFADENVDLKTIKLMQIFPDRNACFAAFEEFQAQFTEGGTVTEAVAPPPAATQTVVQSTAQPVTPANVPDGWEAPAWAASAVPDILKRLDEGQTPAEVAKAYDVEEKFVIMANANR